MGPGDRVAMIYTDMNTKIYTDNTQQKSAQNQRISLLYADLTYKIRGCIFNVYNELGFGHKEQVYQKALEAEFITKSLLYQKEEGVNVAYKGKVVGNYRPDFIVDGKVILELKAIEFMPKFTETQLLQYLKTTGYELGLLVNFGSPKLYIKRLVWSPDPRKSANNPCESVPNQRKSLPTGGRTK